MAVSRKTYTQLQLRFDLSCTLSVARLPWLWLGGDNSLIASELVQTLVFANQIRKSNQNDLEIINQKWKKIILRGLAIREFENAMEGHTPDELKDRIIQNEISKGELLWQGESGFCVAIQFFRRSGPNDAAMVLMFQGQKGEVTWGSSQYIIPIRALLNDSSILPDRILGQKEKAEINALLDEVARYQ